VTDYEFSVATSVCEREAAFRLRYAVFVKEVGAFTTAGNAMEVDEFDEFSTHFVATCRGEVVGTVRMQRRTQALARRCGTLFGLPGEAYYDYSPFERDGVNVAEVSRSSVLPEHRGSKVLANLWKIAYGYAREQGATHYMSMVHVGYTDSTVDASIVHASLERSGALHPRYHLPRRRAEVSLPAPTRPLYSAAERQAPASLRPPAVMRLFHRFGLRACGKPVFIPSIGRVGLAMLACPETFSASTLEFFHAPDASHRWH
jgi:putative hemolysin